MSFAQDTNVPVERSRAEIERILTRYGADKFMVGSDSKQAVLAFQVKGKMIQFTLPLPDRGDKRFWFTPARKNKRTDRDAYLAWEQACRSRWRALRLCIQAKLEAVACGITSFESEFLAHFVMPDGRTVGNHIIPQIERVALEGKMPSLLMLGDSTQ